MLRRFFGRLFQLLGVVGLPGDVRIWWNILTPAVPSALTGFWAYTQQASLPTLALLVLGLYSVFFLASIPLAAVVWKLRAGQQAQAPQAPEPAHSPRTIQAGSIGSIGSVSGDVHISITHSHQGDEPPDEDEPDDELDYEFREHFEDEAVHLPVFPIVLDGDIYIRDRTFTNCRIYGPAVVVPTKPSTYENTFLSNCTFYGEPDAILWPSTEERSSYLGVLAFEGCVFDSCDFFWVGILVKENDYPIWLERWREEQRQRKLEEGSDETPELEASDEEPSNQ